ncbi:hypothetical protein DV735_g727, partial [Chaetothyriales sp. CBS 134920]
MRFATLVVAALSALSSTVTARSSLQPRQSCVETCGSTCYWQSDIDAALEQGYSLYQSGDKAGSSSYPHTYNNYEGFSFPVSGPYQEFPILSSYEVYTGGSPGPDRVIFNTDGEYADLITHTGASGNNFVDCS